MQKQNSKMNVEKNEKKYIRLYLAHQRFNTLAEICIQLATNATSVVSLG